jgi:hypothetical protein
LALADLPQAVRDRRPAELKGWSSRVLVLADTRPA